MQSLLTSCSLCPRDCHVDRLAGEVGVCGASGTLRVARAALHFWEEPPISGTQGSGTVFFSHCPLKCAYCQNIEISRNGFGKDISIERLTQIFHELQAQEAHNINLVSPTHYVPQILEAIEKAREEGLALPIVYNSSGYEKRETVKLLEGSIDVFLSDFKYADRESARRYSLVDDYTQHAEEALEEMVMQVGAPRYQVLERKGTAQGFEGEEPEAGSIMSSGVIVRHLLLPGKLEEAKRIVSMLQSSYGSDIVLSLMSQFTPPQKTVGYAELNTRVTQEDYERLLDHADTIGVKDYFWQEGGSAEESFIPAFDTSGV